MFTGFAVSCFLSPNKIVLGGVSGIAIILNHTLNIPLGLSNVGLNTILLILGFKVIGKGFTLKTIIGVGFLSLFIQIFSYLPSATSNNMIATLFGGCLYGAGIGITLVANASTGGTDIIGRMIQHKFKTFPIGKLIMVVDGLVILSSIFVFNNIDLIFLGILAMFISTYVIDYIIKTLNVSKIAFVITDKGKEISEKIVGTSSRGVTRISVEGAYTNTDKTMLFCAMKEAELSVFQKKVIEIDPDAFIVYAQSQQILGNGFYVYR